MLALARTHTHSHTHMLHVHPPPNTHTHTHTQIGVDMDQLWSDLGVAGNATHVPSDRLIKIYHDYMSNVEQQCLANVEELLLERHDIFDPNISEAEMITRVSEELKVRLGLALMCKRCPLMWE